MSTDGKLAFKGFLSPKAWQAGSEVSGFLGAEAVAEFTWMGVAFIAGFIPKPAMDVVCNPIGKYLVEPVLDPFEKLLVRFCKLEECKPDLTKSPSERAATLVKLGLTYGIAIWASLKVKLLVRRGVNNAAGVVDQISRPQTMLAKIVDKFFRVALWEDHVSPQEKMIYILDEIPHYGSMYLLNNQLAPTTDGMIRVMNQMLQNVGMGKDSAHELATAVGAYGVPNLIGAVGGSVAIVGKHFGNWPSGRIGSLLGAPEGSHAEKIAKSIGGDNLHIGH